MSRWSWPSARPHHHAVLAELDRAGVAVGRHMANVQDGLSRCTFCRSLHCRERHVEAPAPAIQGRAAGRSGPGAGRATPVVSQFGFSPLRTLKAIAPGATFPEAQRRTRQFVPNLGRFRSLWRRAPQSVRQTTRCRAKACAASDPGEPRALAVND